MAKELKVFDMDNDRSISGLGAVLITIDKYATLSVEDSGELHGATILISKDKLKEIAYWILDNTKGGE